MSEVVLREELMKREVSDVWRTVIAREREE